MQSLEDQEAEVLEAETRNPVPTAKRWISDNWFQVRPLLQRYLTRDQLSELNRRIRKRYS